jgi:hypothetical protein
MPHAVVVDVSLAGILFAFGVTVILPEAIFIKSGIYFK